MVGREGGGGRRARARLKRANGERTRAKGERIRAKGERVRAKGENLRAKRGKVAKKFSSSKKDSREERNWCNAFVRFVNRS